MTARPRGVVISGIGIVSGAVVGRSAALGAYLARPHRRIDAVPDAALADLIDEAEARRLSRACQLTVAAARLATSDAEWPAGADIGLVVGTELGDMPSTVQFADGFLARGPAGLSPLLFPNTVMNAMASSTAIALSARRVSLTLNAPTIAGELAVARAAAMIRSGRAERLLAGGVDPMDPLVAEVLDSLGAAVPTRSEGATMLVLESATAAAERGAPIRGEILGVASEGLSARPHGVGRRTTSRAIAVALANAAVDMRRIAYVYGSASGDAPCDRWERSVLDAALAPPPAAWTSLGMLLGRNSGTGALAVAAAAWTARAGLLPEGGVEPAARRVPAGPGLVHGIARGGGHVALVVGFPAARE